MRIRLAIPDHLVTPPVLEAALEATALANQGAIERGEVPSLTEAIHDGVRWKPEPYLDGEHFDLAHQVTRRGWGDCDDLAPWLAAELRATGQDVGAVPRVKRTGKDRWHVVVQTSDGQILDPSRWAGMGKRHQVGVGSAIATPFAHVGAGALCVMPKGGKWWSRVDLPWADTLGHVASHARGNSPEDALDRAIGGAIVCGEAIDAPRLERLRLARGLLLSPREEVISDGGEVGSIFGDVFHAVGHALGTVTKPLADVGRTLGHAGVLGKLVQGAIPGLSAVTAAARIAHGDKLSPEEVMGAFHSAGPLGAQAFTKLADQYVPGSKKFMDAAGKQLSQLTAGKKLDLSESAQSALLAAVENYAPNLAEPLRAQLKSLTGAVSNARQQAGGAQSLLASLTRGVKGTPPGAHVAPSGGVSVPLKFPDSTSATHPMIFYHPAGSIGPVVMRF